MSPYRENEGREPVDGLAPGERIARERRASRRRAITVAAGVPLALLLLAGLVGWLLDLTSPTAPKAGKAAPTALGESATDGATDEADAAQPRAHGPPWGTVTAYCYYERCPTYAEAWANVREGRDPSSWCIVGNRAGPCTQVETGTCGAFRYVKVDVDATCGGSTRYFDDAGALIGVEDFAPSHERTDGGWRDPVRARTYGHIPDCDLVPTESACVKPQTQ
jgi:hypothetical protein